MLRTNTSGSAVGQHTLLRVCTPLSPQQHHFWVSPLGAHIEDQMSRGFGAAPHRETAQALPRRWLSALQAPVTQLEPEEKPRVHRDFLTWATGMAAG